MNAPRAGVYAAPDDAARVTAEVRPAHWIIVDVAPISDKSGLLTVLAAALRFPPHFGHNWDALADCLQDAAWMPASPVVLELRDVQRLQRTNPEVWAVALDILRDAAKYWSMHGKTMLVLVHGAHGLPALPT